MLGMNDLVFEDGVQKYLDVRKQLVENCNEVFLFGSARGGKEYTSI